MSINRANAKKLWAGLAALLSCSGLSLPAFAQTWAAPDHAFFGGAGAGYNHTDFGKQDTYAIGTSDNYENGSVYSTGSADGYGTASLSSPSSASPNLQVGYFQHFSDSPWLWGAKFSYTDLLASTTQSNVGVPQAGTFTYTDTHEVVPFTGTVVIGSYKTKANSRFSLMPFIGRSFGKGFVYLGMGATVTQVDTDMDDTIGYATSGSGVNTNISGAPANYDTSGWVLGGAVDIGVTYFLSPTWFLDADYTAAKTAAQKGDYNSTFVNADSVPGTTAYGTLAGYASENIVTQSLTITLNKAF
ncbi:hypothetical protein ACELLULO517_07335 [Acidisoma cellulosilytica]|uniref:Outer membrane protein beta-barrel domain-containing protein n=1 Tax=Acidisoma cellulosilyticum TaxID=2802395 RepID=A0A963YZF9_9PROT|nr:hypothetical protein [Acidisoma cellulosilyticum]MCB8880042.1 hypothetical protein [Acidisoma cellulosilyticum]